MVRHDMADQNTQMSTGTTTLGILCKDGVVLAADKRATAGHMIMNGEIEKVIPVTDTMALTTAGSVSDIQRIVKYAKAEFKLKELRTSRSLLVKEAANFLSELTYQNIRQPSMIPGISHFIFGGVDTKGFGLYDIFPDGSITDVHDFIASGSGSSFVYGILETQYKKDMSIEEGVTLAVKSINAAIQRDSASGNGIDVFKITKNGVERVMSQKLKAELNMP